MKQTITIAVSALGIWLGSATAQASPVFDGSHALKTSAVEGVGIVEQAHWRYHRYYRHHYYRHHYRRW